MLFNSVEFLIFFPIVCLLYFIIPHRFRYIFLLICSYFFYMCWNPQYALLILTSTAITYASGLLIDSAEQIEDEPRRIRRKKLYVALSFTSNLAILFFFKYYAFAADTIVRLLNTVGIRASIPAFDVILPVGNKNDFKIILEEDSKKLDEVVVVGYATQKKVNLLLYVPGAQLYGGCIPERNLRGAEFPEVRAVCLVFPAACGGPDRAFKKPADTDQ